MSFVVQLQFGMCTHEETNYALWILIENVELKVASLKILISQTKNYAAGKICKRNHFHFDLLENGHLQVVA